MIKKLSRKITIIIMIILMIVLAGILLAINIFNYSKNDRKVDEILTRITAPDNDKKIKYSKLEDSRPDLYGDEKYYRASQFYVIEVDETEELLRVENKGNNDYSNENLYELAKKAISSGKYNGFVGDFAFRVKDTDEGRLIAFVDNSIALEQLHSVTLYSIIFGLIGSVVLFFVSLVLTKWIVKPVSEVFDKQRQFISDASHELKTPLTIIHANIDTIEHEYGDSKYFKYVKDEISSMTGLINQLLSLAKVENTLINVTFKKFNLSRVVESASLPFDSVAFENNVNLDLKIEDGIFLNGNEEQIKQLVGILVDNAIKHTWKEKNVKVNLSEEKGKALLKVMNEGKAIPEEEIKKIFERFYRVDKARNRAEGRYGLGLAIAKAIVELHKGKIHVECKDGWTIFIVRF